VWPSERNEEQRAETNEKLGVIDDRVVTSLHRSMGVAAPVGADTREIGRARRDDRGGMLLAVTCCSERRRSSRGPAPIPCRRSLLDLYKRRSSQG
jgi:hypothetical protein